MLTFILFCLKPKLHGSLEHMLLSFAFFSSRKLSNNGYCFFLFAMVRMVARFKISDLTHKTADSYYDAQEGLHCVFLPVYHP